jgi:hypothetical protein
MLTELVLRALWAVVGTLDGSWDAVCKSCAKRRGRRDARSGTGHDFTASSALPAQQPLRGNTLPQSQKLGRAENDVNEFLISQDILRRRNI